MLPSCTRRASGFTHLLLPVAPTPRAGPCARYACDPKTSQPRMRPLCQPPRPAWGGAPEAAGGGVAEGFRWEGESCGALSLTPSRIGNGDVTPFLIIAVIIVVSKVLEPQARWRLPAGQPRAGPGGGGCQQDAGRRGAESGWRGPARYPEKSGRMLFNEHLSKHCAELCASHSSKGRQATPVGRGRN